MEVRRWTVILVSAGLLTAPYLMTALTPNSICFSETKIVGAQQKVAIAKRWLMKNGYPIANQPGCCEVSKGRETFLPIGLEAYLTAGKAHYVFVPKTSDARIVTGMHRTEHWNVVAVDSCGAPLSVGVDL